jgi:hypothetical protein
MRTIGRSYIAGAYPLGRPLHNDVAVRAHSGNQAKLKLAQVLDSPNGQIGQQHG